MIPDNNHIDQENAKHSKLEFSLPLNQIRNFLRGMTKISLSGQPPSFALTERNIAERGKEIAQLFQDKRVIDLGCGTDIVDTQRFAKMCRAIEYIGVDIEPSAKIKRDDLLPTVIINSDLLRYLKTLEPTNNTVFIISGIDAQPSEQSDEYFQNVAEALKYICRLGSVVIIGPYTHELNLDGSFEIVHKYLDTTSLTETKILKPRP